MIFSASRLLGFSAALISCVTFLSAQEIQTLVPTGATTYLLSNALRVFIGGAL